MTHLSGPSTDASKCSCRTDLVTQCAGTTITVSPQCPLVANTLGRWLLALADSWAR